MAPGGHQVRDLVEIGMGRTARRAYELDDVEIVPSRRTRSSRDVSTTWQIDAYRFDIPLITHPTDAVVSPAMAIRIELLTEAIGQIAKSGVTVAARVSPQHARDFAPDLLAAGVEILVVQGTIVSAEHVSRVAEPLNLVEFIASMDVPAIVGGVSDYRTAMHLMRTGAAGVIVGHGAGASTSTGDVLGIGVPMATAVADAAAARRDYLDETGGRYVHVIADGGMRTSGDVAKAIACGADAVMLGEPLA